MIATLHSRALNILLVEDDDGDAKAVQRAFQKAEIANPIVRAMDGLEAIDMLKGLNYKAKIPPPSIIITDLNMPKMNGVQFVSALREDEELHRSIVFILTTSKRDEDRLAVYNLNVAGYIVKETVGRDFLNLVGLMDCYWRIVEIP